MQLSEKERIARSKICLALDNLETFDDVKACVEELNPVVGMFKIGKELFTRFGPEIVNMVHSYQAEVFFDQKFHDIPNTVKGAAYAATQLGVFLFNVHAVGGSAMMRAALEGANEASARHQLRRPKIVGVTVLTSIDRHTLNSELRIPWSVEDYVLYLAQLTNSAGLDGIVCAATELAAITTHLPPKFFYVTPGIQGPTTAAGSDQKRVATPYNAVQDGANILVIGRAITAAPDRVQAAREVLADIVRAL